MKKRTPPEPAPQHIPRWIASKPAAEQAALVKLRAEAFPKSKGSVKAAARVVLSVADLEDLLIMSGCYLEKTEVVAPAPEQAKMQRTHDRMVQVWAEAMYGEPELAGRIGRAPKGGQR